MSATLLTREGKSRGRLLIVVMLSSSPLMALIFTSVSPALPAMASYLGGSRPALLAQLIMMISSIGIMTGGPAMGFLVDRFGPRQLLLITLLLYGAAGSAGLYLSNATAILVSRFILGVAASGVAASALTLVGRQFDAAGRARIVGYQSACGATIGLLSTLLSGYAVQENGWRLPFSFYLISLVIFILAVIVVPGSVGEGTLLSSQGGNGMGGSSSSAGRRGSLKTLLPLLLGIVPLYAAVFTTSTQVGFLLRDDGILSSSTQALVIATAPLSNAVGASIYGAMSRHIKIRFQMVISVGLMAMGHLLLGGPHGLGPATVGCVLAGFGSGLLTPHLIGRVLSQAPESARGRATGAMYAAMFLGSFMNPLLIAPVTERLGVHAAVGIVGCALSLFALIALFEACVQRSPQTRASTD